MDPPRCIRRPCLPGLEQSLRDHVPGMSSPTSTQAVRGRSPLAEDGGRYGTAVHERRRDRPERFRPARGRPAQPAENVTPVAGIAPSRRFGPSWPTLWARSRRSPPAGSGAERGGLCGAPNGSRRLARQRSRTGAAVEVAGRRWTRGPKGSSEMTRRIHGRPEPRRRPSGQSRPRSLTSSAAPGSSSASWSCTSSSSSPRSSCSRQLRASSSASGPHAAAVE